MNPKLVAIAGVVVAVGLIVSGIVLLKKGNRSADTSPAPAPSSQMQPTSQLKSEDTVVGTGDEAQPGKKVTVNYTGTLTNGTKFDSSYDHNQPFSFTLGAGQVIKGWDQGAVGMKVGGKRRLTIPPDLGYGSQAQGNIPANSTLVFDIELLSVE